MAGFKLEAWEREPLWLKLNLKRKRFPYLRGIRPWESGTGSAPPGRCQEEIGQNKNCNTRAADGG